jgi:hypothetical protein
MCKTTRCHNPEDHNLNSDPRKITQISYNINFLILCSVGIGTNPEYRFYSNDQFYLQPTLIDLNCYENSEQSRVQNLVPVTEFSAVQHPHLYFPYYHEKFHTADFCTMA